MDSQQLKNGLMLPSEIFIMNWMQGVFVCWLDNCNFKHLFLPTWFNEYKYIFFNLAYFFLNCHLLNTVKNKSFEASNSTCSLGEMTLKAVGVWEIPDELTFQLCKCTEPSTYSLEWGTWLGKQKALNPTAGAQMPTNITLMLHRWFWAQSCSNWFLPCIFLGETLSALWFVCWCS